MQVRRGVCRAAMLLWPALLAASPTAATTDPPPAADDKPVATTKKTKDGAASLRIELLATKAGEEQPSSPIKNAMVKIAGEDVWYRTDGSGKTQRFTGGVGARELLVRPPGSNPCSVAISLKKGDQDLTILVQTAPEFRCILQPAP
jgi:hypothetical protein